MTTNGVMKRSRATALRHLEQLRKHIDRIDDRVLALLVRRARIAIRVGALKRTHGRRLFDRQRERAILRRMAAGNPGPLSARAIRAIYQKILREVRHLEERPDDADSSKRA